MEIGRIEGCNKMLGAPADWDEARDGLCGVLPVRIEPAGGSLRMISAWLPNSDELVALAAGAAIHLHVIALGHPVVALGVGPLSEDGVRQIDRDRWLAKNLEQILQVVEMLRPFVRNLSANGERDEARLDAIREIAGRFQRMVQGG